METIWAAIAGIGTVCTIIFGYAAFHRNRKKDDVDGGAKNASIMSDLGYIKSSVDDIKRKQEKQDEKQEAQHLEVVSRLTAVEGSVKQAHKRIDTLEKKNGG